MILEDIATIPRIDYHTATEFRTIKPGAAEPVLSVSRMGINTSQIMDNPHTLATVDAPKERPSDRTSGT